MQGGKTTGSITFIGNPAVADYCIQTNRGAYFEGALLKSVIKFQGVLS